MIYPYHIYVARAGQHIFYAAECPLLKGCVGQGESAKEALEALELSEKEWLETAKEHNFEIPKIPVVDLDKIYSEKK